MSTLTQLEEEHDKNLVLETRREYIKIQLKLEECERRHQEIFHPDIGEKMAHILTHSILCPLTQILT